MASGSSGPVGELWFLPGSPYSARVRWTLALCRVSVNMRPYKVFVDQPVLWARLGFPAGGWRLTVPVLFPSDSNEKALRSSHDISRYLCGKCENAEVNLFPEDQLTAIEEWAELADHISAYGRAILVDICCKDANFAVSTFMPRKLRNIPFVRPFASLCMRLFAWKYPETIEQLRPSGTAALDKVQETLRNNGTGFLCGSSLTFADIAIACAIFFKPNKKQTANAIEEVTVLQSQYDDLLSWRAGLFDKYFPDDEASLFDFRRLNGRLASKNQ